MMEYFITLTQKHAISPDGIVKS